jgi:hypothetical protein
MNSIDNPKETRKLITLAEAKVISASKPIFGRKYPRPGWEKYLCTREGYKLYLVNSGGRLYVSTYKEVMNLESFLRSQK